MTTGQDEAAAGLMYYQLKIDGRDVQTRLNPFELPTTTETPNVEVVLSQLLQDPETGRILRAPGGLFWDGEQMFRSIAEVAR